MEILGTSREIPVPYKPPISLWGQISAIAFSLITVTAVGFMLQKVEAAHTGNSISQVTNHGKAGASEAGAVIEALQISDILSRGYLGTYGMPPKQPRAQPPRPTLPINANSALNSGSQHLLFGDWQRTPLAQAHPAQVQLRQTAVTATLVSASKPEWQGKIVKQSYKTLNIKAGHSATFWFDVKNTGTKTWHDQETSDNFIALNAIDPSGRQSLFQHPFWPAYYRPAVLRTGPVKPGETVRISLALQAPEENGEFQESFQLVAENLTFIAKTQVHIKMKVSDAKPLYKAKKAAQSEKSISLARGEDREFWVEFKNTGRATWTNSGDRFLALNLTNPAGRVSVFENVEWYESYRPAIMDQASVAPGASARFTFMLHAPDTAGDYSESFQAVAEFFTWIEGTKFSLPITLTNDQAPQPEISGEQPRIRVGLYDTTEPIIVSGLNGKARLRNSAGKSLATPKKGENIKISYKNAKYTAKIGDKKFTDSRPFRVEAKTKNDPVEVESYSEVPSWLPEVNFNKYRGSVELVFNPNDGKMYVVNELPLESYMWGLGEAGNRNDLDYLGALVTAARTYALYHYLHPTKHASKPYLLTDTAGDQVYKGYGYEVLVPNIVQAAKNTAGYVVTYDGEVVVTPYFSRSDGRTRSWEEVWAGGPKGWLKGVDDPGCVGMVLWGHGIGLSAEGARWYSLQGKSWSWILKHYYTGIKLTQWYE